MATRPRRSFPQGKKVIIELTINGSRLAFYSQRRICQANIATANQEIAAKTRAQAGNGTIIAQPATFDFCNTIGQ